MIGTMKNVKVIEAFLNREIANTEHLFSTGEKLISYKTCIAEWYDNILLVNVTRYSQTTSAMQNRIIRKAPYGKRMWDIPRETQSLSSIYEQKGRRI